MALQSRMHLARPRGVRPGCRVCPMDAPRTPAPARAKQQAPGGVPGTWIRPPDRGYFAHPLFDFKDKYTTRTEAMRWIQNCQPHPDPAVEQKNIRPSAASYSISRVCLRPAGTRIFKTRLFGGLRGRRGRETLGLAMSRGNKKRSEGRGVRIRV